MALAMPQSVLRVSPLDKPNLVCGPVQVCWHKFGQYFDVEVREVPLEGDRLHLEPEQALAHCDENTIMVVPTFGLTMTCQYEPVQAIARALDKLQAEPVSTFPSTSMRLAVLFSRRFASRKSSGIFGCRGSSQSIPPAINSASRPSAWDG